MIFKMNKTSLILLLLLKLYLTETTSAPSLNISKKSKLENGFDNHKCFCKLNGDVDDCQCKVENIDKFNNYRIYPRLLALMRKDYFRYLKVNLKKLCQFWSDDAKCSLKDCHVQICTEDDLPANFKSFFDNNNNNNQKSEKSLYNSINNDNDNNVNKLTTGEQEDCEQANPLGHINKTVTDENLKTFENWKKFDDAQDNFCEPEDEYLANADYADLLTNPERFTGYKAPHSHKIWNAIYKENCFEEQDQFPGYLPEKETCLEKRVFHRLISGLHASINIHVCAKYLHKGILNQPDYWGPNPDEFKARFDPANTNGQGPQWLKNLYFIYLVELRAITKAAPYFEKELFYTGLSDKEDLDTKRAVLDLLNETKSFKNHFDESNLFKGNTQETIRLKEQFQLKFRNITKIMDCVGCDKCRLWGKVQTLALGTALKILFSGRSMGLESTVNADSKQNFQITRHEIVALFNGFARLSSSIAEIETFRELLAKQNNNIKFEF